MPYSATVAIVGVGGIFPDAPGLDRFWDNIRNGRSAAREVPAGRWLVPPDAAFAPEVGREDRVYSRRGCFIDAIPPLSALAGLSIDTELLADLDPLFHLLLHAGKRAFDDGITAPLDRKRVGIIIGNLALPSEKSSLLTRQILGKTFEEKLLGRPLDRAAANPLNRYVAGLPAGILAHALGLGGGSCTLDAACASSLYAIKMAMDELLAGRADAMLTGGVSRPDPLYTQMGFSQLRALSKRGVCTPFDASGDGLVVGEGAGLFLLKRTEDAMAHGDRIYGIIRGVGLTNDVGGSLLAPMTDGQLRAMGAAYARAGWDPRDVDLIECHATGTPVGDATEVASLRELWGELRPEEDRCVIGSVKSNIGHLLTAAGAAALTKVLLAMKAKTLPPTAGFTTPQSGMGLEQSPFRVLTEATPWPRRTPRTPRRAAVSAFGFGGINAHLLVEEWLDPEMGTVDKNFSPPLVDPQIGPKGGGKGEGESGATGQRASEPLTLSPTLPFRPAVRVHQGGGSKTNVPPVAIAVVGMDAHFGPWQSLRAFQERVLGGDPSVAPTGPGRWWSADRTTWFREEGLAETPFTGFYLDEVAVSPDRFRIPPKEMEEMLPQQLLMLKTAAGAMADAGLDREGNLNTGVFVGIALDLNSTNFSFRWGISGKAAEWAEQLGRTPTPEELAKWSSELRAAAGPPLTANRTMGALGSIVASRIAREFRIGGPSFTLSSEESSGLRALETAVRSLQLGEIDRALVGAVDLAGDLRAVLGHHDSRPFSASGTSLPFDERADGSLVGEGAAAVVLKRVEDAERDGDRIYGVIRGIGASGGTTLLPGADVYGLAMERAYAEAGVDPATITYLEAHATGQPAEDRREASALSNMLSAGNRPGRSCAVSGITPDIGHSGAASGIASFVRCCLALYNEIIPPCRGVERPLDELSGEGPLYIPRSPSYWLRNRDEGPRRAGVSVFGVDGTCVHVVLEGWDKEQPSGNRDRVAPLGTGTETLFALTGENRAALAAALDRLRALCSADPDGEPAALARQWYRSTGAGADKPLALTMVARSRTELNALLEQADQAIARGDTTLPPSLRDRLFHTAAPLGPEGKIAFVFPGSGNHYPGMGADLSARWPEIFRRQDLENRRLRSQFLPELFWNGASAAEIDDNHLAVIFGQVATGCAVSDIVRSFGVEPRAVIGYSLGESAGLFALRAWKDRDLMLARMEESTLFTHDLAGDCRAAAAAWGLREGTRVEWSLGVVEASAREVRQALRTTPRVYLLIVNAPDECVVGGDAKGVRRLVAMLGCHFHPLHGVTTVHCEVAKPVAQPYHDLHLFTTDAPRDVVFYSGARGDAYDLTRESAANAILAQAVEGIDYPAVIEAAYASGVRTFLEMGPGSSCSRMIGRILADRPHLARSACYAGQDQVSIVLRMLAHLVSERVPVDLSPLFAEPALSREIPATGTRVRVGSGGASFAPPLPAFAPPALPIDLPIAAGAVTTAAALPDPVPGTAAIPGGSSPDIPHSAPLESLPATDAVVRKFAAAQEAQIKAHAAFLRFSDGILQTMAGAVARELALVEALGADIPLPSGSPRPREHTPVPALPAEPPPAFDRDLCFEFARGSVGRMLGPDFAEVDSYPTRVRLPDEPLMLVDRIVSVEGEPRSMSRGRVVTEHDIHANAWYLDGSRIPTCIAVEAGQADLFLSGYLGIDFITKGMAVYRLLDAVVTFHRGLPGPGETIHYDIWIERFFRQGDTWLFRFFFEATVNGEPLLSMRDGCAGFFSAAELEAGKGIVRPALDLRPTSGTRSADWQELVPMANESYDASRLARLRAGDLAGCFGPLFGGLNLGRPLTIPGGRMELVHRVMEILPRGGRYGEGFIRAEADIRPDDWFITCHFVDDRVMPGTLMYECCMHTLRIFLLRMGWVAEDKGAVWEPVPGVASGLRCRGQVLETTKVVTYEVAIRELGYRPEPFVICDALMYADGKPIVEITNMSARLAGTTKGQLTALWHRRDVACNVSTDIEGRKPALYTKKQILAYSNGNPSEGFGEQYRIFDAGTGRKIARLPGPPFQFMDRVTAVKGEPWRMVTGAMAEAQYDIPTDAWYFTADRQPRMPFSVLLEAALQPCGWLAAYVGSALTTPLDISFRNLGGTAVQHRPVTPESGPLTCTATMKKVATSGGMIIQEFDFTVADARGLIYAGDTMFGFFSKEALANQVGIRDAKPYQPPPAEIERGRSLEYPGDAPFPEKQLRMIDRIEQFIPDGGPEGLGYLHGTKRVDPDEWFFTAHFYEDPVTPGSLGLESFTQLLKFAAVERWGWEEGNVFEAAALGATHRWLYRGQIVPTNSLVTVVAWVTAVDNERRILTAAGYLSVDGKTIYQMNDFTVRIVPTVLLHQSQDNP